MLVRRAGSHVRDRRAASDGDAPGSRAYRGHSGSSASSGVDRFAPAERRVAPEPQRRSASVSPGFEVALDEGVQDCRRGPEPVRGLVEDHRLRSVDHRSGDFLAATCGQAVHEQRARRSFAQKVGRDAIRREGVPPFGTLGVGCHPSRTTRRCRRCSRPSLRDAGRWSTRSSCPRTSATCSARVTTSEDGSNPGGVATVMSIPTSAAASSRLLVTLLPSPRYASFRSAKW